MAADSPLGSSAASGAFLNAAHLDAPTGAAVVSSAFSTSLWFLGGVFVNKSKTMNQDSRKLNLSFLYHDEETNLSYITSDILSIQFL